VKPDVDVKPKADNTISIRVKEVSRARRGAAGPPT